MLYTIFLRLISSGQKHDIYETYVITSIIYENLTLKSCLNLCEFTYPEHGPANACTHEQQREVP